MKLHRILPLALTGGLLLSVGASAIPAGADPAFNPVMTVSRSEDAARAATGLHVEIAQADGEEQVGDLRIAVPRAYTFNTDAPGDGAQIGSAQLQAYINPRPSTLTIDATVHDGNADCPVGKQCVLVKANIPGIGAVELPLEIEQTATEYVIAGDISGLWNDDYVRGVDARLKKLVVDVYGKLGSHTVFGNPATAGSYPFTYAFKSARIDALGHAGGLVPNCGAVCNIALSAVEYPPTIPYNYAPVNSVSASDTSQTFMWVASSDRNGDAVTYDLTVTGPSPAGATGITGTSYTAGQLAPGTYAWNVTAVDATDRTTTAPTSGLTIIDAATSMKFTSAANGDTVLVKPGTGFVYRIGGSKTTAAEYGAATAIAPERGVINYSGNGFSLTGPYDGTTGTAALAFRRGSNTVRPLVDPAAL